MAIATKTNPLTRINAEGRAVTNTVQVHITALSGQLAKPQIVKAEAPQFSKARTQLEIDKEELLEDRIVLDELPQALEADAMGDVLMAQVSVPAAGAATGGAAATTATVSVRAAATATGFAGMSGLGLLGAIAGVVGVAAVASSGGGGDSPTVAAVPLFTVTDVGGVVNFNGTATGDITVSIVDGVATFSRDGEEARNTVAGLNGKTIHLVAGQTLNMTLAELKAVEGLKITGAGDVYVDSTALSATEAVTESILIDVILNSGNLTFDLPVDDNDVLILSADSVIDLKGGNLIVDDGQLDAKLVDARSFNVQGNVILNSGLILTVAQLKQIDGQLITIGTGKLEIVVSTASEATELATLLELLAPQGDGIKVPTVSFSIPADATAAAEVNDALLAALPAIGTAVGQTIDADSIVFVFTIATALAREGDLPENYAINATVFNREELTVELATIDVAKITEILKNAKAPVPAIADIVTFSLSDALSVLVDDANATVLKLAKSITLTDTDTDTSALSLNTLDGKTSLAIDAMSVTTLTGTAADITAAINSVEINTADGVGVTFTDIPTLEELAAIKVATSGEVTFKTFTLAEAFALVLGTDNLPTAQTYNIDGGTYEIGTFTLKELATMTVRWNEFQYQAVTAGELIPIFFIADTAVNLLTNTDYIDDATAVTLIDGEAGELTVANEIALKALTTDDAWTYSLKDSAAKLAAAKTAVLERASSITTNSTTADAAALNFLDSKNSIAIDATAVTTLAGTAADITIAISSNGIDTVAGVGVTVTDASATELTATDLLELATKTTGTVMVSNAVVITGSTAELTAALVSAETRVLAGTATVTVSDASATTLTATALLELAAKTTGTVTVSNAVVITGSAAELTAALVAPATRVLAGTASVTLTDTPASLDDLNAIRAAIAPGVVTLKTFTLAEAFALVSGTDDLPTAQTYNIDGGTYEIGTFTLKELATMTVRWNEFQYQAVTAGELIPIFFISDTAVNLLTNTDYIDDATAVTLIDGEAGELTVANEIALKALTTVDTWTYSLKDSVANLMVAKTEVLEQASSITTNSTTADAAALNTLNGKNSAVINALAVTTLAGTAADIAIAISSDGIDTVAGVSVTVTDASATELTATALLSLAAKTATGAVTVSNAVVITGSAAELMAVLVTPETRVLASRATVKFTDTPTDAESTAIENVTSVAGSLDTYTLAEAFALLEGAGDLPNAQAYNIDGGFVDFGTITVAQLKHISDRWDRFDAGAVTVGVIQGVVYRLEDTAANLLANTDEIDDAIAVTVIHSDAGVLTLAEEISLRALTTDDAWTYRITDTSVNILFGGTYARLKGAVAVAVTDGDAGALDISGAIALKDFTGNVDWNYSILETIDNLLKPENSKWIAGEVDVTVYDFVDDRVTVSELNALNKLNYGVITAAIRGTAAEMGGLQPGSNAYTIYLVAGTATATDLLAIDAATTVPLAISSINAVTGTLEQAEDIKQAIKDSSMIGATSVSFQIVDKASNLSDQTFQALGAADVLTIEATSTATNLSLLTGFETINLAGGTAKITIADGVNTHITTSASGIFQLGDGGQIFTGSAGNDAITGGIGADRLTGGGGQDTFTLALGGAGTVITDFAGGPLDFDSSADFFQYKTALKSIDGSTTDPRNYQASNAGDALGVSTTVFELLDLTTEGTAADLIAKLGATATNAGIDSGDSMLFVNYVAQGAQIWSFTDASGADVNANELTLLVEMPGVTFNAFDQYNFIV